MHALDVAMSFHIEHRWRGASDVLR